MSGTLAARCTSGTSSGRGLWTGPAAAGCPPQPAVPGRAAAERGMRSRAARGSRGGAGGPGRGRTRLIPVHGCWAGRREAEPGRPGAAPARAPQPDAATGTTRCGLREAGGGSGGRHLRRAAAGARGSIPGCRAAVQALGGGAGRGAGFYEGPFGAERINLRGILTGAVHAQIRTGVSLVFRLAGSGSWACPRCPRRGHARHRRTCTPAAPRRPRPRAAPERRAARGGVGPAGRAGSILARGIGRGRGRGRRAPRVKKEACGPTARLPCRPSTGGRCSSSHSPPPPQR